MDSFSFTCRPWQMWKARWFGKRVEGRDGETVVVGYWYKGMLYVTEIRMG